MESDLDEGDCEARDYSFDRPFGIPVRYHDLRSLGQMSNFDIFEFHLSYKDIEESFQDFIGKGYRQQIVVHAPELFQNDHILDLCSLDADYRKKSVNHMKRVIDIAQELGAWFNNTGDIPIVVNVGGFTSDRQLSKSERNERYEILKDQIYDFDTAGVELLPQTMPPLPWHFGGQRYQNLFVDPNEISSFCEEAKMRICLDVSHSKLACNYYKWSFSEFVELVGGYTRHLHIADASGVDGEGLQVHEGEIDFVLLEKQLRKLSPLSSFIPEIWQGHKDNGRGFWTALDRLEKDFARV